MAPKKAYFELLAQPAKIIPYTPKDETTKTKSNPTSTSIKAPSAVYGINPQFAKLKIKVKTGAKTNKKLLAFTGTIDSLIKSFNPSAKGCNIPQIPTTFGPLLRCTAAIIFRSKRVK
jgi:hypothetical protein